MAAEVRELLASLQDTRGGKSLEDRMIERAGHLLRSEEAEEPSGEALAGTVLGVWRLERPLGRGGMAEVWEARRISGDFEQTVAAKLLKRGMDSEEIVRRFLRERQILARLDHPGIARLYDGGLASDGRPYFVLEKIEGEPISEWCERRSLTLEARLRLIVDCARAVAAAHRLLVVHRDLKPSNILVTSAGEVKLLDFGIAKLLEDDGASPEPATRTQMRWMTPAYAAPEQILGEPVSTATDVYSLGVVLFELLTGRLPHRRSASDPAGAAVDERVERPSSVGAGSPSTGVSRKALAGDLDTLVLAALQRAPERRYASMDALADDIERFLAGRPIAARRDTLAYRARKFVGRNRLAVGAGLLLLLSLVGGLVATAWQARRARENARRAEANSLRAERVQRFLVDVFRNADPGQALGADLTARQILAAGVAGVDRQLESEPEIAADLYDALAEIHQRRGLVAEADGLAVKALALREGRLPHDPARIGATLRRLAGIRLEGEVAGALQLAERARDLLSAAEPDGSFALHEAEGVLAQALLFADRPDEAVAHQREALALARRWAPADSPAVAEAELQLAKILEQAEQYDESETLYRTAIAALVESLGPVHPTLASARRDLAGLLDRRGRAEEAEPLLREALAAQRKVLGNGHWQVGETLFSYGVLLNSLGRLAEAESAFREALNIEGHAMLHGHVLRYLGINLAEQRQFDEAVERLNAAVTAYRAVSGADSVEGWRATASLGFTELRRGRAVVAEAKLREAVAALERLEGPKSYVIRQPRRQLGEAQRALGRLAESIATLRGVRALEIELFGTEDHADVAITDLQLARSLGATANPAHAEEIARLLDHAIARLRVHRPESIALAEALLERGERTVQSGIAAGAREDLREAADRFEALYGPDDQRSRRVRALLNLGSV